MYVIPRKDDKTKNPDYDFFYLINSFGHEGGFENLLNLLKDPNKQFDQFCTIVELVCGIHQYLHYDFSKNYLREIIDVSHSYLREFVKTGDRNFKRDRFDKVCKFINESLLKIYLTTDANTIMDLFGIDVGICCIKSETLDKQILGLKILTETITEANKANTSTQSLTDKHLPTGELIEKILNINILDVILNSHNEIIKNSSDLIRVLLQNKKLTNEDLEKIWTSAHSGDIDKKNYVYKLLSFNTFHIPNDQNKHLVQMLMQIPSDKINSNDLELTIQLYKALPLSYTKEIAKEVSSYFFDLTLSDKHSQDLSESILNEYINLLKPIDMNDYFCDVLEKCVGLIRDKKYFIKAMKFIRRSLSQIASTFGEVTKNKFYFILLESNQTIEYIFNCIHDYHKAALASLSVSKESTKLNHDNKSFIQDFSNFSMPHKDVIVEIFSSINFITTFHKTTSLTKDQISSLFKFFVETPISINDTNHFFKWLKDAEEKKIIPDESNQEMFIDMSNSKVLKFTNLTSDLFNCLWNIFMSINKSKGLINMTEGKAAEERYSSVGATGTQYMSYSYNPNNKKEPEVILEENPLKLNGFELIWKLVMCSPPGETIKNSIQNLMKIFMATNLNPSQRAEYWNALLEHCINTIQRGKDSDESDYNRLIRVENCLLVIKSLIEESEKKGTAGCISHSSLLRSSIKTLNVTNSLFNARTFPVHLKKKFQIKVFSNTTLWDLKKLLGNMCSAVPEAIKISSGTLKDISDNEHGKTLSELHFKDEEIITLNKNTTVIDKIQKVQLMDGGEALPRFRQVLKEIFEYFTKDGKMTMEDCAAFATVATNSIEQLPSTDTRVTYVFNNYDKDKDGIIYEEDFALFFKDAAMTKLDVVWDNIKACNYRNDLKKIHEPIDEYNNDRNAMPRYILSKNQKYFNTIFALQDEEESIAKEASKLLSTISTNPEIFKELLILNRLNYFFEDTNQISSLSVDEKKYKLEEIWNLYMDNHNNYKLLYSLQIIDSFFEDLEFGNQKVDCQSAELSILDEKDQEILQKNSKVKWVETFLTKGGVQYLINNVLLRKTDNSHTMVRKCFNMAVKILSHIFNSMFKTTLISNNYYQNKEMSADEVTTEELFGKEAALEEESKKEEEQKKKADEDKIESKPDEKVPVDKVDTTEVLSLKKSLSKKEIEEEEIVVIIEKCQAIVRKETDFDSIIVKLMDITNSLLNLEKLEYEERVLISNSLNLWALLIMSNEEPDKILLTIFKSTNSDRTGLNDLFLRGILLKISPTIRFGFSKIFSNICEALFKKEKYEFVLKLLDVIKNKVYSLSRDDVLNSKQLFILYEKLFGVILKNESISSSINYKEYTLHTIESIKNQEMSEEILSGHLRVINIIVENDKSLLTTIGHDTDFIQVIVDKFLLRKPERINSSQIQVNLDEEARFKLTINENLAYLHIYNLLSNLVNDEETLNRLFSTRFGSITQYTSNLQNKKFYTPSQEKKGLNGYVGIKNLGATCYMNSILQQFFSIPSLRYALLRAEDKQAPNFDNNLKVDDNILHQIQRMFSFLELSNRIDYFYQGLCYSLKDWDVSL